MTPVHPRTPLGEASRSSGSERGGGNRATALGEALGEALGKAKGKPKEGQAQATTVTKTGSPKDRTFQSIAFPHCHMAVYSSV